jgi:hypothetical protein
MAVLVSGRSVDNFFDNALAMQPHENASLVEAVGLITHNMKVAGLPGGRTTTRSVGLSQ